MKNKDLVPDLQTRPKRLSPFEELLRERYLLFDGAIGTRLYAEGVMLNRSFEEQNISNPDLVRRVHRSYIEAGADVLTLNTFSANRFRLAEFGLEKDVAKINREGLALLRSELDRAYPDEKGAAQPKHLVAASIGPCLTPSQLWQEGLGPQGPGQENQGALTGPVESVEAVEAAFTEQLEALCLPGQESGSDPGFRGPDLLLAETFSHARELEALYRAYCNLAKKQALPPLALGLTIGEQGLSASGFSWADFVLRYGACEEVCALMLNCGLGPAHLFHFVEQNIGRCPKPLLLRPNAGYPQESNGRTVYLTTPEYFTLYGKRFRQIGAAAYGGCCGTRPEHIAECAKLLRSLNHQHIEILPCSELPEEELPEPVPLAERSRWGEGLASGRLVSSVELLPPRTPVYGRLLRHAQQCHEANIDAINIPDGPRASARISPLLSAIEIEQKVGIETILHYTCRDRNLLGIQADLLGGYASGLRNVLAVTGDPPKLGDYPDSSGVFDIDAIGLTQALEKLKQGRDIGSGLLKKSAAYAVGVALNPVALNLESEIERYVRKVAAGADFAITQPVFAPETLLHCLKLCDGALAKAGLAPIPVIVGIWPLAGYKNAEFLANEVPGVEIPPAAMERMSRHSDKEAGLREGVALAREVWQELKTCGPPIQGVQVSAPFGRVEAALDVIL
ncbi:bifunctional homocysteine S-methyltransferase/methylenetetrahydrofolate reductase [Candidatus Haliotispira prima]|uniref:Bifunctional homocysteine S-methyltransferase/methylenetetrahydrofolate reductase n=1 Tax=Candidatus Haliotispira prima TaxID=3034016 RepID=A0ABY8MK23_9SPIO|nr:bifunctional homocysteine S-methyltransferase/methylenetetrahydrofolate reductase [Candidatus Haliotispira prima]